MSSTLTLHVIIFLTALSLSLHQVHSNCRFSAKPETHNNGGSLNPKTASSSIQGMFVFGSSLVDNGNNNFLRTIAKANYPPYGADFALGPPPTGRFTNGKNVVDLFGQLLGLPPYLPPFSNPMTHGERAVNGVDFASGGSGILDDTGSIAGEVMSLKKQISGFEGVTLGELELQLGCNRSEFLSRYLFLVGSGGNDYTLNFFRRNNTSLTNLQEFTSNLTATLSLHLQKLYGLGGRKFVLMAVNPLGCSPSATVSTSSGSGCDRSKNRAAKLFNSNLRVLILHLTLTLRGSHFVLVDSYKIIKDIINDPLPKGFTVTGTPCCDVPTLAQGGNGVLCRINGLVCANRTNHVYFDGLHPTEAMNIHIANKGFSSLRSTEVYPFNIHRLASLI